MVQKMADALDIDLDPKIKNLKKETEERISQMKGRFYGKSCALFGPPGRTLDLAALLVQLDIEPKVIMLHHILPDDIIDAQNLLARGIDPLIFRGDNALQTEKLLSTHKPDICVGSMNYQLLAQMEIDPCTLISSYYKLGFEATNDILRLMCQEPAAFGALKYKEKLLANGAI